MRQWTRLLLALPLVAGLCLAAAPPVALAQGADVVWVCPSGDCGGHTPGHDAFDSVQAGIDAVAAGGTVHVAAGTYSESVSVDKAVTLQGAGAAASTIHGATDLGAAGIAVRDLGFSGGGAGYIVRLVGADSALLEDAAIAGIAGYPNSYGLLVTATTGATCRRLTIGSIAGTEAPAGLMVGDGAAGNAFEGVAIDDVSSAVSASGVAVSALAQDNTFAGLSIANVSTTSSGHPVHGIYAAGGSGQYFDDVGISSLHGGQVRGAYLAGAQGTTLHDVRYDAAGSTSALDSLGILVDGGASGIAIVDSAVSGTVQGVTVSASSATVLGCRLTGNGEGVEVNIGGTVAAHENDLAGNSAYGVRNRSLGGPAIDATRNWWGSAGGPGSAGSSPVSPGVTFSPWLGDGSDTSAEPGFQPAAAPLYAVPTRLAFASQPGGAAVGAPLSPQPVVRAEDAAGNLGINFQGLVTLAIGENPGGGALVGTRSLSAAAGVAAFGELAIDEAGSGYTLVASANGLSPATSVAFAVASPAPTLGALAPDHATAGAGPLTLAVTGTGFAPGAVVRWDGAARPTTYVSATGLTAELSAADLAAPGTATVSVANPDGTSAGLPFTVRPQPTVVYVNPTWAPTLPDADPDGTGPATHFLYDAFAGGPAALAAVAPGGRVVVAGGALAGGLTLSTDGLTVDLNGATVGPGSPAFLVDADDVTIEDGILDGAGDADGSSAIVVSAGVARLWVHDCEIRNWPADGIHLNGAVAGLKIVDNDIHSNGGDGIELNGSPAGTVVVRGNSLRANAGYGINAVTGSVAAPYNEWGHIDGPTAGDGVSGAVSASPWVFGRVYAAVPGPPLVREGAEFDVDVRVDAAGLYGAQLGLAFDPALLEVVSVAASGAGYLTGALPATVAYDNAAGTLTYRGARQAPDAAYSAAGGALLTVRFRAHAIAGAAATATVDLAETSVRLAAPGGVGVLVDSVADAAITILGETSLSGVVQLQGRGDWSGALVDPLPGVASGLDPDPALTDAWGRYALAMVDDRYTIEVSMARYLPAAAEVDVAGGSAVLATLELLGGDVDGADGITIDDITAVSGVLFGTEVDPAATAADVNYDGRVDILDLVLAAGNYGLAASPWTP